MSAITLVATVVVAVVALVWAANRAIRGVLTVSDVVVFVPAVFATLGLGRVFDDDTPVEYGTVTLPGLEAVERGAANAVEHSTGRRSLVTDRPPTVELRGVTFRYPGSDDDVLRDVTLKITSGTSTALVGLNGAGKTTLVRMLCGLYAPDRGAVLVDGVDLRELDLEAWHARIAPMFQEFVRLQVGVRENVTAGAIRRDVDDAAVWSALEQADARGFVDRLPEVLETVLATKHAGGHDLSGGQWQRLGVARAMYGLDGGAGFLILDEPTSNLDTSSEERVVERLVEGTRGATTTLLVTHRLSLARRTDRIFVMDGGKVVETGSHDELVSSGGRYADAFDLQASMYPLEATDG
jgi:ATP-binding cassette, subfamily B, bacterial